MIRGKLGNIFLLHKLQPVRGICVEKWTLDKQNSEIDMVERLVKITVRCALINIGNSFDSLSLVAMIL